MPYNQQSNHCKMKINPRISVIVIAYQRKKFIMTALESLFKQSFSKDLFEIIVVKNFIDTEIDKFIKANKVKNIYTDTPDLGNKCINGIENSSGEIIVFLEDDDFFASNRLEVINKVFEDEEVVYFHNGHYLVDSKGNISKSSLFAKFNKDLRISKHNLKQTLARKALKVGFSFNLSSIAVRRSIFLSNLSSLRGMNIAIDNYMFYVSLASGKNLIATPLKLTYYRLHEDNSSLPSEENVDVLLLKAQKFLKSDLFGFKVIDNIITDPLIKHLIECRMIEPRLNLHVINSSEVITMQDFTKAIKCGLMMRRIEPFLLVMVDLLSNRFKPLGTTLYIFYLKKKHKGK